MNDPYQEWRDRELVKDHEANSESFNQPLNFPPMTITRNPDVAFYKGEKVPLGYYLHDGNASRYAKIAGIPFGIFEERVISPASKRGRIITTGLIIREEHREAMNQAVAMRGKLRKANQ